MRRPVPTCLAAAALLVMVGGTTAPPATVPALDPVVTHAFDRLADPDPDVRDAARQELMGLSAEDGLPKLLAVVRAAHPLWPDQAVALHEIVCQVYLAGDHYDPMAPGTLDRMGAPIPVFVMGVHWQFTGLDEQRLGVPVEDRWPGFPAARMLRGGDMILSVANDAEGRPPVVYPTHTPNQLVAAVQDASAGQDKIVLSVLRYGRPIRVPITLVPRPAKAALHPLADEAFLQDRQQRAEDYWRVNFGPLVDPDDPPDAAAR